MSPGEFQHVTVIGVGLMGGSLGLAIKARNPRVKIAGVGRRKRSLDDALTVGAIDTAHLDAAEAAGQSDLIILATPVGAFERHLRVIAPVLRRRAIVTDVGSTKAAVVRAALRVLGKSAPFVGSHPMAGSEHKGVRFAKANLFDGTTCIITPTAQTPQAAARRVEKLWRLLGMRVVRLTPAAHDKAMARISHLPHALASLLMVLAKKADLDVSASGFRDTTRLASGDAEMWRDIFLTNRKAILAAIDEFDEVLYHLRDLIQLGDAPGIEKFLTVAKRRRDGMRT
ncbi:MAG: prephenate dehydrogenase [Planctomycetota bacterium]|nr:prephenate dehydrogenase [Planctomycetota bacterium]